MERTLLCDTVNGITDPKAMLDVFTDEELCGISAENCASSNDTSSDSIVKTNSGTLIDKGQACREQSISRLQYQQSEFSCGYYGVVCHPSITIS